MKDKAFLKLIHDADPEWTGPLTTTKFIDTGSYIINAAVSASIYGGFPSNRITAIHSPAGVGKTFFAMSAVKTILESDPDAQALYFDTEFAIDPEFLSRRQIDSDRVHIMQPASIEEYKTISLKFLSAYAKLDESKRQNMIMVLDSLGMLPSVKEAEDSENGKNVRDMTKQQGVRSLFRTTTQVLGKVNIPLIVCAHSYTDIMTFKTPQKMSGGGGLEYACSTILALRKKKEAEMVGKTVVHDSNIINVKVDKSRFSREGRQVQTRLHFTKGVDRYYGLLGLAAQYGVIKKLSKQYEMPDGSKHFGKAIIENPEKFFTADMLEKIDQVAKIHFSLGSGGEELLLTDAEGNAIVSNEDDYEDIED